MNPSFRTPKQALVFALAAALAVAWLRAGQGKPALRTPFFLLPLAAFLAWSAACAIPAENRYTAALWLALWVLYGVFALLLSEYLETADDCTTLFRWVCGAAVVVCLYGFLQVAGIDFIRWNLRGTPLSTIGRRNFTGEFIVMVIPYALCLLTLSRRKIERAGWCAVLACYAGVLFFTFTRASWLACAVSVPVFLLLVRRSPRIPAKAAVAAALAGLLAFAGSSCADGFFKFERGTVSSRLLIWKTSLRVVRDHPLLGVGPDNFPLAYAKAAADDPAALKRYHIRIDDAHNDYLEVACESGLPGLGLFLLLLAVVFRQGLRVAAGPDWEKRCVASAAVASAAALCVNAAASFPFSQPHSLVLFWLDCAALEVLGRADPAPRRIPLWAAQAAVALFLVGGSVLSVNGLVSAYFLKQGESWQSRSPETALWHFRIALAANPFNPYALQDAANAAISLRRWDDAFSYLTRARALHPYLESIYNNLGVVHAVSGRMKDAEQAYRYALHLNPTVAQTWNNLGSVYLETGTDLAEAERCFRKALELDGTFLMAHFNLGVVLAETGRTGAAAWEFEYCVQQEPGFAQARAWLEKLKGIRR